MRIPKPFHVQLIGAEFVLAFRHPDSRDATFIKDVSLADMKPHPDIAIRQLNALCDRLNETFELWWGHAHLNIFASQEEEEAT